MSWLFRVLRIFCVQLTKFLIKKKTKDFFIPQS
jgi:hypothetical protein